MKIILIRFFKWFDVGNKSIEKKYHNDFWSDFDFIIYLAI